MAEILGQSLWNNRFIRCKDKPIFYRQFSDRGINTISDLITEDRKFLRWSKARDKYQLSNKDVMKWLGAIESIPKDWESFIENEPNGFNRIYSISNEKRVKALCVLCTTENQRALCIYFATVMELRNYGNQFNTGAKTISVCQI